MPIEEKLITNIGGTEEFARFDYTCGHCSRIVSGRVVNIYAQKQNQRENPLIRFIICPSCIKGSIWMVGDIIVPGSLPGEMFAGLPSEIKDAYQEARKCFSIRAYTGCELLCRKILMHIGVDKGAQEGLSFVKYLDYLENEGFITPPIKSWADIIRKIGNQATHELNQVDKEKTETTFMFTMQLLKIIYEMDYIAKKFENTP